MFSEAKLSNVAPSSACCEKWRGETSISETTQKDLCSPKALLKNGSLDHFRHATSWQPDRSRKIPAEEQENGAEMRETEENVEMFTAL